MGYRKSIELYIYYLIMCVIVFPISDSTSSKCQTFMTSACNNDEITSWNKINVGKYLRQWLKSVKFEYKWDEVSSTSKSYCKALIMREMPFFANYAPDVISSYGVLLGNILPESYEAYNQIFERQQISDHRIRFKGPVWADLNNHLEWIVETHQNKITARLSPSSILKNGVYYGILDNNEMKLGVYV